MQLRIFTEPQMGATYDDLLAVARRAEDTGFDAFFRSDHYLTMGGDGLPGPTDAWVTLAGLARETTRIRLGTLMTAATFRLPGPLAISVAQVDQMSGGRVELGIGAGWFAEEHAAYGFSFPDAPERFDMLEDQLAIVTGLWATDHTRGGRFSYVGKQHSVTDSPGLPKPYQTKPPIIMGGAGKRRSAALAARYADEYNLAFKAFEDGLPILERVKRACEEAGRDPASMITSSALGLCVGKDEAEFQRRAAAIGHDPAELRADQLGGTVSEVLEKVGRYADSGQTRLYLQTLDLHDLDHLHLVAEEIKPVFGG